MRVISELGEIRKRRKSAGMSQVELSSMVGISQSHLAKIEAGKVDPSYSLVVRIFDALEKIVKDECWRYMSKDMMIARKGDKVEDIAPRMKEKGYSQVPVFEGGEPIGMLTEQRIIQLKKPYRTLLVEDAMEDAAIIPKEASYSAVAVLANEFGAVLVKERGKIVGIITTTDLIGHEPKKRRGV